jgi:enoyl-CoA hydratase/carnithine racemase
VRTAIYKASREFHRAVAGFGKPLVAAIQGHALGTGFDLAVMCDLRIAAQGATMGHPEARMGGVPVVTPLRHIVGDSWSRRLCFDGSSIDADTALRIGLVIDVVAPGDLSARAMAAAEAIALTPVDTLKKTKRFFLASPAPESWIVPEHDEVFEQGHTIFNAVK